MNVIQTTLHKKLDTCLYREQNLSKNQHYWLINVAKRQCVTFSNLHDYIQKENQLLRTDILLIMRICSQSS